MAAVGRACQPAPKYTNSAVGRNGSRADSDDDQRAAGATVRDVGIETRQPPGREARGGPTANCARALPRDDRAIGGVCR